MAVDLATAFIRIVPKTEGMQKSITEAFKGMGKIGENAGKDLAAGLEKNLASAAKGTGKPVGDALGKDIDSALQKAVKGAGKDAGDEVAGEFDKSASAGAKKSGENFVSSFSGAIKGLNFGVFAGVGMQAVQTLSGGLSNLVSEAVSASDATDKFKQTMNFAGLDTSAIEQATKAAQVYADETVYELSDIQNMTAQLAANGVKDYTGLANAAGNLNAIAGGNAETFKSVGMAMSQTAGAGKLTTENFNQIANVIPGASGKIQEALKEAGAYTGDFREAMAKGEITAEEFNDAVMKLGSEPVAVEAAKSTKTFEGMLGNLQAALAGGLKDAFDQLKPSIESFVNGLTGLVEKAMPLFNEAVSRALAVVNEFVGFVQIVPEKLGAVGAWFQQHAALLIGAVVGIAPVVVPIMMTLIAQWSAAGAAAVASAAKQVGAWVSTQVQAVRAGAVNVMNLWKTGAGWVAAGVKATVGAAKIAAAWVIAKGRGGLSLIASLAAVGAGWIKAGAKALLGATRMAAAWFIGLGPIAWVTTAVVAVGAALWAFFTKTETGRQLWASFTQFIGQSWESIKQFFADGWARAQEVFASMQQRVEEVKVFFADLGASIADGWTAAVESVKSAWASVAEWFTQSWETIKSAFSTGWESLKSASSDGWESLKSAFSDGWESLKNVFSTGWDFLKSTFFTVWENYVNQVKTAWDVVANGLSATWETVKQAFSNAWQFIQSVVFEPFKAAIGVLKAVFSGDTAQMSAAFAAFKEAIHNAVETIKARLRHMVDGFKEIPGKIRGAFANAGSWLIDAGRSIIQGLANGIRNAGSMIADAVRAVVPDSLEKYVPGLHFGGIIPAFARGGVLPDVPGVSRAQRDPILGWSTEQKQPIARVEPGEFIVNRESTRRYLPLLAAINRGTVLGKRGDFGLPRYADGGVVGFDDVLKFLRGGSVGGKKAPRSLEGAPYTWGGGLLGNWGDCSGAMSGVAAFITGAPLAGRKFATGNEGQVLAQMGFKRGTSPGKNAFEVGYFNGGPYGGHTSGTLYDSGGQATNVEMGGGRGNGQIGGAAAGARHSQYTDRYWIGLGASGAGFSSVDSTSVDGMTVSGGASNTKRTIDWGTASTLVDAWKKDKDRSTKLAKFNAGIFDTGGVLKPGNFAFNASGKPERVLNPALTKAFEKLADAAPHLAGAMEKYVKFAEQQARTVQGGSIQAYLGSLSAAEGVGLVNSVASVIGIDGINSMFGGVAKAWEGMEDAAIGQVDAADAVKQAEKNLQEARKSGDVEAIAAAESDYADALGAVKAASKASGQAQIAMALEVAETIVKAVKWVFGKVGDVLHAMSAGWSAVADSFGAVAQFQEMVRQLRADMAMATLDQAMAEIQLADAMRNVRIAQMEAVTSQLQGAVGVAKAEKELRDSRKEDARQANVYYQGLGASVDYYRHKAFATQKAVIEGDAAKSENTKRLEWAVYVAKMEQLEGVKKSQEGLLRAQYESVIAALDVEQATQAVTKAANILKAASKTSFGLDEVAAKTGQRWAQLQAERAQLVADQSKVSTWLNPVNWFTKMPETQRRLRQIDEQLKELEKREDFNISDSLKQEAQTLVNKAGAMGFFGAGDDVASMVKNSPLGDAARALDEINFEKDLQGAKSAPDELRIKMQRRIAEMEQAKQKAKLDNEIHQVQQEKARGEAMVEYHSNDDRDTRQALKRLADAYESNAKQFQALTENPQTVVVPAGKSALSFEEVEAMLTALGHRVQRLETPIPPAQVVAASRR